MKLDGAHPRRSWRLAYRYVRVWPLLFAWGCSGNGGPDGADAPDTPGAGTGGSPSASCPGGGDRQPGSGTITGTVAGRAFDTVASARWIGAPDSAQTTVVYLFSQSVACAELCTAAWDERIQDGTQVLELKLFGEAPGSYGAVTTPTPAPGEASVNTTLSLNGMPDERSASGGSVELSDLVTEQVARGSFTIQIGSDELKGTFDAAFCPGGHEP